MSVLVGKTGEGPVGVVEWGETLWREDDCPVLTPDSVPTPVYRDGPKMGLYVTVPPVGGNGGDS